jgi:hypothetical protein
MKIGSQRWWWCGSRGCATAPDVPRVPRFLKDAAFAPPAERFAPPTSSAFCRDEMQRYIDARSTAGEERGAGQLALVEALYSTGDLKLEYDSAIDAQCRAGLCGALGELPVAGDHDRGAWQSARAAGGSTRRSSSTTSWARSGDMYLAIGT